MNTQWRLVERQHRIGRFSPTITLRRSGFAISADFVRKANITGCTRVSLLLSHDGRQLAFHFHNNEHDNHAFRLGRDGGGRNSGMNRGIAATGVFAESLALRRLVDAPVAARRFEPIDIGGGRWAITIVPCFEQRVNRPHELPEGESGIYRYVRGDDVLYIGKGKYRDRCRSPERAAWEYDYIEFSRLNDSAAEAKWETFWLNDYRKRHGRLPVYNRIGGKESWAS
jgi:hypothetical protein